VKKEEPESGPPGFGEFVTAVVDVVVSAERDRIRRPDGYVPVCEDMMLASTVGGTMPPASAFRYLMTAGRRLDGAHVLVERTRSLVDVLKPIDDQYRERSARGFFGDQRTRQDFFQMVNEAEMALIALNRSLKMAERASQKLQLPGASAMSEEVSVHSEAIAHLRNAYEHIDERIMGRLNRAGKADAEALGATMLAREGLLGERRWKYRQWSFGIDDEATTVMVALRNYLWGLWIIASESGAISS